MIGLSLTGASIGTLAAIAECADFHGGRDALAQVRFTAGRVMATDSYVLAYVPWWFLGHRAGHDGEWDDFGVNAEALHHAISPLDHPDDRIVLTPAEDGLLVDITRHEDIPDVWEDDTYPHPSSYRVIVPYVTAKFPDAAALVAPALERPPSAEPVQLNGFVLNRAMNLSPHWPLTLVTRGHRAPVTLEQDGEVIAMVMTATTGELQTAAGQEVVSE